MRPNRQDSLKQRLHRGDPGDFTALLQGVSTLVEEVAAEDATDVQASAGPAVLTDGVPAAVESPVAAVPAVPPADPPAAPSRPPAASGPSVPNPVLLDVPPDTLAQSGAPGRSSSPLLPLAPPRSEGREDRLRGALDRLACQLTIESGHLATAMRERDTEAAGFRLAHVNQVLDLLRSIDSTGDLSRQLGVRAAPPEGRSWPGTAWTLVEFAESPFSGLLAEGTGEGFVREMLYSAWGIGLEPAAG